MEQRAAALDVLQEAMPEARALGRAGDEPGDVGEHERRLVTDAHDAEMRRERRERIVRDLRLRSRDCADERRLADVREAEQPDVGHDLELEAELELFAGLARLGASRRAIVRGREVDVAATAFAAARDDDALLRLVDVVEQRRPSRDRRPACRSGRGRGPPSQRGRSSRRPGRARRARRGWCGRR